VKLVDITSEDLELRTLPELDDLEQRVTAKLGRNGNGARLYRGDRRERELLRSLLASIRIERAARR
jgi:hypothetical protein